MMSGKCEGIENWRGQLGDCIDSLNDIQQLLFNGNVISDSNSFAKSLEKLRGVTAELSRGIVAPCSAVEAIDLTMDVSKDNDVDEFDSMLCDMNDDEFDNAINSQPAVCDIEGSRDQNTIPGLPSPSQQHVDKLKEIFGHSQFKP